MDSQKKMAELGPLEWAIIGNGALLLLLFVVLLHMICRIRTLSKRRNNNMDPEHGEGLFAPNAPPQPFSAFVALPPKDEASMPPQPIWIPVHHYSTLSMPPRKGRCHSCRVVSSYHPHFSSTLPKKKLNVDFAK